MALTDQDLNRWQRGELAGLEALYREFGDRVYRLCLNLLWQPADAEDAAQEVFLRLFRSGHQFRGESSPSTFIYRSTVNHCLNIRRKQVRQPKQIPADLAEPEQPAESGPTPLQAASLADEHRHALELIERLPEDLSTVLLLRESEGLKYREIAEVLEIPMGTVMSRLDRARKELQWMLGDGKATTQPDTKTIEKMP